MTNTATLSVADIDITHGEEPRILDTRIGKRLGMARPTNIRTLIEDNREELERYGSLHAVRAMITAGKGAQRETTAYYLNEGQTLLLCMFSRTAKAADVREEVIRVFMAYRAGAVPVKAHTRRKPKKDDRLLAVGGADCYDRHATVDGFLVDMRPRLYKKGDRVAVICADLQIRMQTLARDTIPVMGCGRRADILVAENRSLDGRVTLIFEGGTIIGKVVDRLAL